MADSPLDIAIVGAGAAGLMAAIFSGRTAQAARPLRVAALDGATKLGAKILVAGGGRCNVTHDVVKPSDFFGSNSNLIARVLRSFDVPATVRFFAELGVGLKREETGKLFPTTDNARTVLDALASAVVGAGATLRPGCRVQAVRREGEWFVMATSQGKLRARRLVLATGGRSLPRTGSDGQGYELARALGHTVTPTTPALVPLVLPDGHFLMRLSGVAVDCELALASATGRVLRRETGAMLLTHFGLSGPAVLDISRHWLASQAQDSAAKLTANLLPGMDYPAVEAWLVGQASKHPRNAVVSALAQRLPQRLAQAIAADAVDLPPQTALGQLSREKRRALVQALVALPLPVVRDRGYQYAEATAGGVPLAEVDTATMGSRRCPGLFLCGEILDVDGRIGGYNFQWAWASGRLAGSAAAAAAPDEADSAAAR